MEETRASIRDTVEELRGRVSEAVDWRHYVTRYPGASLTVAATAGMLLGRSLGALLRRDGGRETAGERAGYRGAEVYSESRFSTAASRAAQSAQSVAQSAYQAAEPTISGARRAMSQSVTRLGTRAEGILNRLIDELTESVETVLVPALIGRFRSLIDVDRRGAGQHGAGGYGGGSGYSAYAGGMAGQQQFPTQGRTAGQA